MTLRKLLFTMLLTLSTALSAQVVDGTAQHYAVSYVKDHLFLRNGSYFNVIDAEIEWPEVLDFSVPTPLRQWLGTHLFATETTGFDQAYSTMVNRLGQPVTGMLDSIPDDNRFCYITLSARILSYTANRWISYVISYVAEPQHLSNVPAKSETLYAVYDTQLQTVLLTEDLLKQQRILQGDVSQEFIGALFAPLTQDDLDNLVTASIDGLWPEDDGRQIAMHVTYITTGRTLSYDIALPYADTRYLIKKAGRRLIETKPASKQPEVCKLPEVENGDTIYKEVKTMPIFQGGDENLQKYIASTLTPPQTRDGRVGLAFNIGRNGKVGKVYVVSPLSPEIDRYTAAMVRNMPAFSPAQINGKPVSVRKYLSIKYQKK